MNLSLTQAISFNMISYILREPIISFVYVLLNLSLWEFGSHPEGTGISVLTGL